MPERSPISTRRSMQGKCTLRPPLLSCPPEGREEEEEVPGCGTSEEVLARGEAPGVGGTEAEGRDLLG